MASLCLLECFMLASSFLVLIGSSLDFSLNDVANERLNRNTFCVCVKCLVCSGFCPRPCHSCFIHLPSSSASCVTGFVRLISSTCVCAVQTF